MKLKWKYLPVLVALFTGCERPIPVSDQTPPVIGYEVQGTVTDQLGNPVPNVKVSVDYLGDWVDSAGSQNYYISNPSVSVQAIVVNWNGEVTRVLTQPQSYNGWFHASWDGKDSTGNVPPSGIYYVEYLLDGVPRFTYNQVISGGLVATTDTQGRYTIPIANLPVDSTAYSAPDNGNILISNQVIFTFDYPTNVHRIQRILAKGQVTIINLVLQ